MKRLALLIALIPAAALADTSYNSETEVTHDCTKDGEVSINSSAGTFTFTGTCDKLSVNGSSLNITAEAIRKVTINGAQNTVALGGVDKLSVNGSNNKITYKKTVDAKKTKVSKLGSGNKVTRTK